MEEQRRMASIDDRRITGIESDITEVKREVGNLREDVGDLKVIAANAQIQHAGLANALARLEANLADNCKDTKELLLAAARRKGAWGAWIAAGTGAATVLGAIAWAISLVWDKVHVTLS